MPEFDLNIATSHTAICPLPPNPLHARDVLQPIGDSGDYLMSLDNTSIEQMTTCPMKAFYYLLMRREPQAHNAALVYGGAIHVGMEALLYGHSETDQNYAIRQYFLDNPTPSDDFRTVNNALVTFEHYRRRIQFDDYKWEILTDVNGPIIERAFEIPLDVINVDSEIQLPTWSEPRHVARIHIAWSGRVDLLALINNRARVVDHKTTSIGGDKFMQDFQLSNQTRGYVWAGQQLWPDYDVNGICINAIHLKRPAANCSIVDKGPRGGEPALQFFRGYFDYSKQNITNWAANASLLCETFIYHMVRNEFPMFTKSCFGKYGVCGYHDVCTFDEVAIRMKMLDSSAYKDVSWNPLADR